MLFSLKWLFVILHVITASAWFGLGLLLPRQARSVVETGAPDGPLATFTDRSVFLMNIFVVLTLVFSLIALFAGGGFEVYGWPYHTSITLILLLVLDQFFVIRASWSTLQGTLSTDADEARDAATRLATGTGAGHLLWLVTLVLMFFRRMGLS
ncbi:MAG: hypothetical protein BRD33_01480 [Bacteroidetes bacterium QH_6_63_17]|nr:MAG: hypothetical protein BRD33_01480 [Bacteroidetes bacterium QH_6_63_17]